MGSIRNCLCCGPRSIGKRLPRRAGEGAVTSQDEPDGCRTIALCSLENVRAISRTGSLVVIRRRLGQEQGLAGEFRVKYRWLLTNLNSIELVNKSLRKAVVSAAVFEKPSDRHNDNIEVSFDIGPPGIPALQGRRFAKCFLREAGEASDKASDSCNSPLPRDLCLRTDNPDESWQFAGRPAGRAPR